jgi:hypothetical protein
MQTLASVGGIADRKKGDFKRSVYLTIAAIGRNM